jgi:hypothetical protein
MRILKFVSGVGVLFTSLAYVHLLHHYFMNASSADVHDLRFLGSMTAAAAAGVFSLIGAFVLLKGS